MKKLTVLLILLAVILSSCGIITINDPNKESQTDGYDSEDGDTLTPPSFEPEDYPLYEPDEFGAEAKKNLLSLPDMDFDGLTVIIAADGDCGVFRDDDAVYSAAAYKRNSLIAEKYNVKLVSIPYGSYTLMTESQKSSSSGAYFADFIAIKNSEFYTYYSSGCLRNLNSLPYVDFEEEYFNPSAIDQLTVGGKLYATAGYATEQITDYLCLYMNLDLAGSYGIELDYNEIYSGGFTWESLYNYLGQAPSGNVNLLSSFSKNDTLALSFISTGQNYLSGGQTKKAIACNTDISSSFVTMMKRILPSYFEKVSLNTDVVKEDGTTVSEKVLYEKEKAFIEGRALFSVGTVGMMRSLENCGFFWEMLPIPKVYKEQEQYYTAVAQGSSPLLAVLRSNDKIDITGYLLAAIHAASEDIFKNEFMNDAMKKYVSGVKTLDMIEIISRAPVYDFALSFGPTSAPLRNGTYLSLASAINGSSSFNYYLGRNKKALDSYLSGLS